MPSTYTTVSGNQWDMIAKETLGSEMHADKLIKANLSYRHIFIFPAGITLTIPDLPVETSALLPKWKRGTV